MPVTIRCAVCGGPVNLSPSHVCRRSTCSDPCSVIWRRKFEVSADELLLAVWAEPVTKVAASFDVSDKAIEKRCKLLNVPKPPRGYWAKLQNGVPHREALFELGWLWEDIFALGDRLELAEQSAREEEADSSPC